MACLYTPFRQITARRADDCPLWVVSGHTVGHLSCWDSGLVSVAELFENGAMLASWHREHVTRDLNSQRASHIVTNSNWLAVVAFGNEPAMRRPERRFHFGASIKYQVTRGVRCVYGIILALEPNNAARRKRAKRFAQEFTARYLEWQVVNRT